jgi:hypothetical protein
MRNLIHAMTVMKNASDHRDRVNVAGGVELRQGGPQRPHLYCTRPAATTPAPFAGGRPGSSPERLPAYGWRERSCSARHRRQRCLARRGAARIS